MSREDSGGVPHQVIQGNVGRDIPEGDAADEQHCLFRTTQDDPLGGTTGGEPYASLGRLKQHALDGELLI